MQRLRHFIPVSAYLVGFAFVAMLQANGTLVTEVPGLVFAGFGLGWLLVYIWCNRSGGPRDQSDERGFVWDSLNPNDPSSATYYSSGPGSPTHGSRATLD